MSKFLERLHVVAELTSFLVIIASGPIAVYELHLHTVELRETAAKARLDLATQVYRDVDERFAEFVRLCVDHPRLDCYGGRLELVEPPLTAEEKTQQRILFSDLIDVFEVAYVDFHRKDVSEKAKELFDAQWAGWNSYIRKFMSRSSFRDTWLEIRDEHDAGLAEYMDRIAKQESSSTAGSGNSTMVKLNSRLKTVESPH
jgi:hypothetical protein